jgi:pimeloyl-ACP methyl ester carboxylesterase
VSTTKVLRPWDWSVPSKAVHREVLSVVPDGWNEFPRSLRKPPVLFIHGVAHGAWCFAEHWLAETAAAGYPAYALSLRGHGGSGGGRNLGTTLMRDYVHDIMQTIAELPQPPVIVGHSMGAILAQLVAERYPVRAMVLLTPAPIHGAWGALGSMARSRPLDALGSVIGRTIPMQASTLFTGLDAQTAQSYVSRMGKESPLVQYELLRRRTIGPISAPTLVIGATRDALVPPSDVQRTAARLGVQPIWLDNIGHDVMLDAQWSLALDVMLDWLDGVCATQP